MAIEINKNRETEKHYFSSLILVFSITIEAEKDETLW